MDSNILCTLLAQRIPPEQFQLWGLDIHWMSEDYDTPENQAIVADVIANYDTLEVEYLESQLPTYADLRRAEYAPDGDQLDNITKALKYLRDNGTDIGSDGDKQVDDCFAVKLKYPKE